MPNTSSIISNVTLVSAKPNSKLIKTEKSPKPKPAAPLILVLRKTLLFPTRQANNTSNIVISRYGAEDRVIEPVFCEVQLQRSPPSKHMWGAVGRLLSSCVAFLGFYTVGTVLYPISGQVFDEGHGESDVLHSARWHDGDWVVDEIREAWLRCFVWMVNIEKFFDLSESLVTAL
ncbi:uncharacterized protein TNCV_4374731 [Trichonephila clavipes]|uniref:Uncharacterized protein n=1 Tax=Trichonephila clavipes TaxID=2585209 RepID=A0A8X6W292_TRICX|nr:uncharacterized protein TNCV_4374731 [Trichonephila clavipes]